MTENRYHVEIPVERGYLDGTIVAPQTTIPGVLFVHGWGANQEQYMERARQTAALGFFDLEEIPGEGRTGNIQFSFSDGSLRM